MKYRNFQNEKISEIGLGTWQLGNADWGALNEEVAFEILQTFINGGGNFIDTADVYGSGMSEQTIGKFLSQVSKEVFVATKLGRRQDGACGWPQNFTHNLMRQHIESSLQNLKVSRLFLAQLHCIPTEELRKANVFENLRKLKEENLISHWGVSVETIEEALICIEQEGIPSLQIIFNLFRQHVAEEIFAAAAEKNISIIVRLPLASGLLSGKFNEQTTFAATDHRNYNRNGEAFNIGETFSGMEFSEGVKLSREIAEILPGNNLSQLAIRWILDHPQVTTVIPGASRPGQVLSNIHSSDLPPLSSELHTRLYELYTRKIKPSIRGKV